MPCQWTVVAALRGRSLVTATRAVSPLRKRSSGPGTVPLKPHMSLDMPGRIVCGKALARSRMGPVAADNGGRAIIDRVAPVALSTSRRDNICGPQVEVRIASALSWRRRARILGGGRAPDRGIAALA